MKYISRIRAYGTNTKGKTTSWQLELSSNSAGLLFSAVLTRPELEDLLSQIKLTLKGGEN